MKLDLYRSCETSKGSPLRIMLLCCVVVVAAVL